MEKFTIEEYFNAGHKNVEGIFILLSNSDDPEVSEVLSNIKNDENLRGQFNEIVEKALPMELVSLQNMMIDLTANTVYSYITNHQDVKRFTTSDNAALTQIEDFGDYNRNLQKIMAEFERYKKFADGMKQRKDGLISVFCKEIEKFQNLISEVIKFNTIAHKGKKMCFESNLQFANFAEQTSANNRKLIAQLMACKKKVAEFEYLNKEYTEQGIGAFDALADEFSIFNDFVVNAGKKDKEFRESVQAEIDKARMEKSKVQPSVSPAEQERLNAIKKANDLYDELCQDFIRDLQSQYALSSKDMYETFINVKFKKFMERFNMPLSNSASIGTANEAAAQIRNLMNYVSKISENSYTTSVYPFEKQ